MQIKNTQWIIVKRSLILAVIFGGACFSSVFARPGDTWQYPVCLLSVFLMVTSLAIAFIFRSRARKMDQLIARSPELLAQWSLSKTMKLDYAEAIRQIMRTRNNALLIIVTFFTVLITGAFLVFMDESRGMFAVIMGSVYLFPLAAALFFPGYYYRRNLKGDGIVLIGKKFAYFNGVFHNWDFPLSGLTTVKPIKKPFNGLYLAYYYTDRTFTHSAEIQVPSPDNINLQELVNRLKSTNSRKKGSK